MKTRAYHNVVIGLDPRGIDVARAAAARFERVALVVPLPDTHTRPAADCSGGNPGDGLHPADAVALLLSAGQRACVVRETIAALKRWCLARESADVGRENTLGMTAWLEAARLLRVLAVRRWAALVGQLRSEGIDVYVGRLEFDDQRVLTVHRDDGTLLLDSETFTLAVGCRTDWPRWASAGLFRAGVWTAESLLEQLAASFAARPATEADARATARIAPLGRLSQSRAGVVVGAGVRGLEQALLLRLLGLRVTVIDRDESRIAPVTHQILASAARATHSSDAAAALSGESTRLARLTLKQLAQGAGVHFVCDDVLGAEPVQTDALGSDAVRLVCRHGRARWTDIVVHCGTQVGRTADLRLDRIGLLTDENDRIWCDRRGQTWVAGILAVGEVVGFRTTREWRVANVRRIDQSSATNAAHISAGNGAAKDIRASVTGWQKTS